MIFILFISLCENCDSEFRDTFYEHPRIESHDYLPLNRMRTDQQFGLMTVSPLLTRPSHYGGLTVGVRVGVFVGAVVAVAAGAATGLTVIVT